MAIIKCTVCGGELDISLESFIGKCQYCGSTITIPKNFDRLANLYNRAVFLRQNSEFDKAVDIYEEILKENNQDSEAHFGLAISKYGIEFVEDPKTGERIPTCQRSQTESILSDYNYKAALELADPYVRSQYQKDGKLIEDINKRIRKISEKEEPFDIFISYKESTDTNQRTEDSIIAQDLYYELTKMGYKVFYSRKTLESRLGADYEAVIFAALQSAKIMIVLGTRPEHFNAVWVRNEWSRFKELMKLDSNRHIIPAYKGMTAYQLPPELSNHQSQDMGRLGFMHDLIDGLEKIMRYDASKRAETYLGSMPLGLGKEVTHAVSVERLAQNSATFLKLDNFDAAYDVFSIMTQQFPEDHRGWWGLILCETHNFTIVGLHESIQTWYHYVTKLASFNELAPLQRIYSAYLERCYEELAKNKLSGIEKEIDGLRLQLANLQRQFDFNKKQLENNQGYQIHDIEESYERALKDYNKVKTDHRNKLLLAIGSMVILGPFSLYFFYTYYQHGTEVNRYMSYVNEVSRKLQSYQSGDAQQALEDSMRKLTNEYERNQTYLNKQIFDKEEIISQGPYALAQQLMLAANIK